VAEITQKVQQIKKLHTITPRKSISFENNRDHYKIANKRINKELT